MAANLKKAVAALVASTALCVYISLCALAGWVNTDAVTLNHPVLALFVASLAAVVFSGLYIYIPLAEDA